MKIFLICSIRNAPLAVTAAQEGYVAQLEQKGHQVYFPPRDTDQSAAGLEICKQNLRALRASDEIHIFYSPDSQGTHFDMGMAFALKKPIVLAHVPDFGPGKSFARMLREWKDSQKGREEDR